MSIFIPSSTLLSNNNIPEVSNKEKDKEIWYNMKNIDIDINTVYCTTEYNNSTQIGLSLERQIRQEYTNNYIISSSYIRYMISQTHFTLEDINRDYCLFPPHQTADIYRAAFLCYCLFTNEDIIIYNKPMSKNRAIRMITEYLNEREVDHLSSVDYNNYPIYELYFLLTRYFTRPYSELQIKLIEERSKVDELIKYFIDKVFYMKIDEDYILNLLELIKEGNELELVESNTHEWMKWADEYINMLINEEGEIDYNDNVEDLINALYTVTDNRLNEISKELGLELPMRDYATRYEWLSYFASEIKTR